MNNERRKAIREVIAKIEDVKESLQALHDEEREYLDNMPESLQSGDKGQAAEAATDQLQEAIDNLDSAASCAESACE